MKTVLVQQNNTAGARRRNKIMAFAAFIGWVALVGAQNSWAQQNVTVYPGQNIQAIVNQYPNNTTFTFTPGIYYGQSITPQSYDSFIGQPGAIISGATLLTNFAQNGGYWTAQVQVQQQYDPGSCSTGTSCVYPEDLFFNNVLKTRVSSLSAVGPGTWYLNYSTGTAYMADYPWGNTVEMSTLAAAFTGTATSVTISGLTIEKYACVAGYGAVAGGMGGTYWSVGNNEVRFNHGFGIQTGSGIYVHDNYIHTNGELGVGGQGTGILVQNNNISYNNYAGYSLFNEAGGAKFSNAQNVTFQYNWTYNNGGPGFWVDINTSSVNCNANQFTGNQEAAILIELSSGVSISNNYIWNDGFNPAGTAIWWGAGILISDATNVSVYFNTVSNCMNGIAGILANRGNAPNGQPYLLQNVNVNSNWITQGTGIAAGICVEGSSFDNSVYTSWGNSIQYNTFNLTTPGAQSIYWMNQPMTFASFSSMI